MHVAHESCMNAATTGKQQGRQGHVNMHMHHLASLLTQLAAMARQVRTGVVLLALIAVSLQPWSLGGRFCAVDSDGKWSDKMDTS